MASGIIHFSIISLLPVYLHIDLRCAVVPTVQALQPKVIMALRIEQSGTIVCSSRRGRQSLKLAALVRV